MNKKEVSKLLTLIKSNYQNFELGDVGIEMWENELKDYVAFDVYEKLDQHMKSEQWGHTLPKVHFLTKYLTKEKDKDKKISGNCYCDQCKKSYDLCDFDRHIEKCNSIVYMQRQLKKYRGVRAEYDKIEAKTEKEFEDLYNQILKLTLEKSNNEIEKRIVRALINNATEYLGKENYNEYLRENTIS